MGQLAEIRDRLVAHHHAPAARLVLVHRPDHRPIAVGRIRAAFMASHCAGRITRPRVAADALGRVRATRRASVARRSCLASRSSSSLRIFTIMTV
jgi:hypothetical protein